MTNTMSKSPKTRKAAEKPVNPVKTENPLHGKGFDQALLEILKYNKPKKSK